MLVRERGREKESECASERAPAVGHGHAATPFPPSLPPFGILGMHAHTQCVFQDTGSGIQTAQSYR